MQKRMVLALLLALVWCATAAAQQVQPITIVYDYHVRPGKEEDFQWLVNNVGGPVRDKLMAEGVVMAWGVDVPVLRAPGMPSHSIWVDVADWAGVEKVQRGMAARLQELAEQDKKAADEARRKGQKPPKSAAERAEETFDTSKTKDWVFRNIYLKFASAPPPGWLGYSRIFLVKVKPGHYTPWRAAFDKYYKPVLDKLVDDGVIGAWGLGVEEVKTDGNFTHFAWVSYPNMAAMDKTRGAFMAVFSKYTDVENDHIARIFAETSDVDASRSFVLRAVIFKMAPPK
jgi:hypothetical protein